MPKEELKYFSIPSFTIPNTGQSLIRSASGQKIVSIGKQAGYFLGEIEIELTTVCMVGSW